MVYEKVGRNGDRVTPYAGIALFALAALLLVHPAWASPLFSGR
jgi:hypothetical protein